MFLVRGRDRFIFWIPCRLRKWYQLLDAAKEKHKNSFFWMLTSQRSLKCPPYYRTLVVEYFLCKFLLPCSSVKRLTDTHQYGGARTLPMAQWKSGKPETREVQYRWIHIVTFLGSPDNVEKQRSYYEV